MPHDLGPLRIEALHSRETGREWFVGGHRHPCWQLYGCLHGRVAVRIDGASFALDPDQFIFVRPHAEREIACQQRASGYLVALFDCTEIPFGSIGQRTLELPSDLRDDLHALAAEIRKPDASWLLNSTLLLRLLIGLTRAHASDQMHPPQVLSAVNRVDHEAIVARAEAFMVSHCNEPLDRAAIAAAVRVSEAHLARLFKSVTGQTPLRRLTEIRIARARSMLLDSTLAVTAIASAVGFVSMSHFSAAFRREIGVTPSDFRRSQGTIYSP